MESSGKSRLRLVRIVADSILREKIMPREIPDGETIALIAAQAKDIVEAMEAEWEADPASGELREAFHLLGSYLDRLPG